MVLVALLAAPDTADACVCITSAVSFHSGVVPDDRSPPTDGLEVPANTLIWSTVPNFGLPDDSLDDVSASLTVANGVAIPVVGPSRIGLAGEQDVLVWEPTELLEVGETYVFRTSDGEEGRFTVTLPELTEPPPIPDRKEVVEHRGGGFVLQSLPNLFTITGRLGDELEGNPIAGSAHAMTIAGGIRYSARGNCRLQLPEDRNRGELRFGSMDLAGNFSGFGEPELIKLSPGCSVSSGSRTSAGWMFLALGLAAVRRLGRRGSRFRPACGGLEGSRPQFND